MGLFFDREKAGSLREPASALPLRAAVFCAETRR